MPKSIRLLIACDTADDIDQPPGAPMTTHGLPSFMITEGEIALARALPGSYELGRPGSGSISDTQLFHVKPVPGTTMPAQVVSVCVIDTQLPSSSITEMCVVKPGLLSFLRSGSSPRLMRAAMSAAYSLLSSSSVGTCANFGSARWLPRVTPAQAKAAATMKPCSGPLWCSAPMSKFSSTLRICRVSRPPPGTAELTISDRKGVV